MNKREKEVQETTLDDEKKVIRELKQVYSQASKDCSNAIAALNARSDMQNIQSIVYQKQYQQAVKSQIDGILDTLQTNEFDTVASYLTTSYENGYLGAMYDLQGQGIPIISPIDQDQVAKAVEIDSQISTSMYEKLGEDVDYLKKSIKAEVSRGIANGSSWVEMAEHIANGMNSPFDRAMNNSIRIARTEGHRVQQAAQLDALNEAKDNGADVVKQWDATLDDRTRPEHQKLDGQIREIDEEFEVDGYKAMMPGGFGDPAMDCNCRCCMNQRARSMLDEEELQTLKDRAEYFGLDKTEDFADYKEKYLTATNDTMTLGVSDGSLSGDTERTEAGTINVDEVEGEIQRYSDEIRNLETENAVVINSKGEVVRFKSSSSDSVGIFDVDLNGAYVTHNHPASNGIVSFGKDDFEFLQAHQGITSLQCCNEEYDYTVNAIRDISELSYSNVYHDALARYIETEDVFEEPHEDVQHIVFEILKERGYVNYDRVPKKAN